MTAVPSPDEIRAKVAGSSFYAPLRALPPEEREAMFAIYAFCRAVDDIADDQQGARPERAAALARWRDDVDALYDGGDAGQAAFLAGSIARFGLARDDFHAVIDGMQMDVDRDLRWPDAATLDLYCDRVASAVGRLSVRVFGMETETGIALSHHLGRALQLTNILRDIDEDAAIGRVYLPAEDLVAAGVPLTSPAEVAADPRIDAAARGVARQAHAHYREAEAILASRPKGLLIAPRMMAVVYGRILARLEATGWRPPRRRVKVNKLALVWTFLRLRLTS